MYKRYQRFPRLMFLFRRLERVNYEKEMALLDILCDPTSISVDVGAKIGMYTYRMLRHSGRVIAFEPIPVLSTMLRKVFAKKPCRIESLALSDAAGHMTMRIPRDSKGVVRFGRSTIESGNPLASYELDLIDEIEVEVKTLDEFELRDVRFIKVDVEGHELAVLRGATATLARERPTLLIESNDLHQPDAVAKLGALLASHGYDGFFIRGNRLASLASADDHSIFGREEIENFVFVHSSRPDVLERLTQRLGAS